ncbi:hypothetical protein PIB30_072822 [Stylosanthes scabra]|uniref:Uncharacterized protein n=1 Tax=Stylosanthes scabra TaxID=79078 RepID=A0ABU6TPB6_9FABA|nr:hypothetical protein [Stylosanthes scabra]
MRSFVTHELCNLLTKALVMDAKVRDLHQSFMIRRGSAESTQKGGTGCFGVAATFARENHTWDLFRVVVGCRKTINARPPVMVQRPLQQLSPTPRRTSWRSSSNHQEVICVMQMNKKV